MTVFIYKILPKDSIKYTNIVDFRPFKFWNTTFGFWRTIEHNAHE